MRSKKVLVIMQVSKGALSRDPQGSSNLVTKLHPYKGSLNFRPNEI